MKTLTLNELNSVSGGVPYHNSGETFIEGAITGGMVGLLVSLVTHSNNPLSDAALWALAGGLVNSVLRD